MLQCCHSSPGFKVQSAVKVIKLCTSCKWVLASILDHDVMGHTRTWTADNTIRGALMNSFVSLLTLVKCCGWSTLDLWHIVKQKMSSDEKLHTICSLLKKAKWYILLNSGGFTVMSLHFMLGMCVLGLWQSLLCPFGMRMFSAWVMVMMHNTPHCPDTKK